ncbi:MAG: toxic anion resistance protein, partial [Solobacterium sp.]|nr:toxic anion resistance protein [Solobacterium sp.]
MSENNTQAQAITLTLTPEETKEELENLQTELEAKQEEAAPKQKTIEEMFDDAKLSDAERAQVTEFAKTIDITETNSVLSYGSAAQKKVTDFSDQALKNVRTKDLGEVGDLLTELVKELKSNDPNGEDEKKGLFGLFKKGTDKVENLKIRYDKAEANVEKISAVLEDHQIQLLKDIAMLDQMYERNALNAKELSMYIIAGKKKLQNVRENDLPALIKKAQETGLPEDSQAANDLAQACDRFEKKL